MSGLDSYDWLPGTDFHGRRDNGDHLSRAEFDDVLCSVLANGAIVEVKGTRQADGSIVATKVELEDDEDDGDDDDDEEDAKVEGLVSGLPSGTCPALTFTVGTKQVTTSASTTFKDVTCATLVNGMSVEVKARCR